MTGFRHWAACCSTVSDRPGSVLDLLRRHRALVGFDFPRFTGASIARTFFAAASMLGATSFYDQMTRRDLSPIGSFLVMGPIGNLV